jgi:hypothetical protein
MHEDDAFYLVMVFKLSNLFPRKFPIVTYKVSEHECKFMDQNLID